MLMLVEGCVAGFKYPGWFVKEKRPPVDTGKSTSASGDVQPTDLAMIPITADDELLEYLGITQEQLDEFYDDPIEITAENSPGNPRLVDVSFTQDELDNAKTASAEVSISDPVAKFPEFDMTVDMKWWNLENPTDTLTVKRLPVKTDEKTGAALYTYDFSLASGQKEFPTEVEVNAPVQGSVNDMEGFLHKSSDGQGWEEDYYTLSEDGKYYTVRMTHFSWSSQWENEYRTKSLLQEGQQSTGLYTDADGKSLFKILPCCDNCCEMFSEIIERST